ncbi:hypothetical protein AAC387_Pa05g3527 [Persea americana]
MVVSERSASGDLIRSSGDCFPTSLPETVRFRPLKEEIPFPGVAPAISVRCSRSASGDRILPVCFGETWQVLVMKGEVSARKWRRFSLEHRACDCEVLDVSGLFL